MQKLLIILFSIFAAGCTAKYTQTDVSANPNKLDPQQVFTIATPVDGRYVDKVYSGSGEMTAIAGRAAFSHHSTINCPRARLIDPHTITLRNQDFLNCALMLTSNHVAASALA